MRPGMEYQKKKMWHCMRCGYQEPVSQYKQSPVRFCPACFKTNRSQNPMRQK